MKSINVSLVFVVLTFSGLQKVQAQTHRQENKHEAEIKVKEPEQKEATEAEPKEVTPVVEHKEPTPMKEQEVKAETQSTSNNADRNSTTPIKSHVNLKTLPVRRASMPIKPKLPSTPQK